MLKCWEMQSTLSLLSLPCSLSLIVVTPDTVLSMGKMKLFDIQTVYKQMTRDKLNCLKYSV